MSDKEWHTIFLANRYEVNNKLEVRNKQTKKLVPHGKAYQLTINGKNIHWSKTSLQQQYFPKKTEFTDQELENEIWNYVPNFSKYAISTLGRVYSISYDMIMDLSKRRRYSLVFLSKEGSSRQNRKRFTLRVHRLVALTFIPNPKNKKCVNHINGRKQDNRLFNLEWSTHKENMIHAHKYIINHNYFVKPIICFTKDGKKLNNINQLRRLKVKD